MKIWRTAHNADNNDNGGYLVSTVNGRDAS